MSENLADAFGRNPEPGGTETGTPDSPPPRPVTRKEPLLSTSVWLQSEVRERFAAFARDAGIPQSELILRAVEYSADQLAELTAADAQPTAGTETIGTLFPRPSTATKKAGGRIVNLRLRADHLATLERLASQHHTSRSTLVSRALSHYLDQTQTR